VLNFINEKNHSFFLNERILREISISDEKKKEEK